jgi:hypothetical protein
MVIKEMDVTFLWKLKESLNTSPNSEGIKAGILISNFPPRLFGSSSCPASSLAPSSRYYIFHPKWTGIFHPRLIAMCLTLGKALQWIKPLEEGITEIWSTPLTITVVEPLISVMSSTEGFTLPQTQFQPHLKAVVLHPKYLPMEVLLDWDLLCLEESSSNLSTL